MRRRDSTESGSTLGLAKNGDSIGGSGGDDSRAFDSLVSRYTPLVVHVVRRMIRDVDDTEDIHQEVFKKVYEALPAAIRISMHQ